MKPKRQSHPVRALLLLMQPTILAMALILVCMSWRVPTVVQLDLTGVLSKASSDDSASLILLLEAGTFSAFSQITGTLLYPAVPTRQTIVLPEMSSFAVQPAKKFQVSGLAPDRAEQSVHFRLVGTAERLQITMKDGSIQDYRLTRFDEIKRSRAALGLGILAWALLTLAGWGRVYRELIR